MAKGGGFFIVYNRIPELLVAVEANARAAVKRKADDVLRDARSRIHRLSGELQDTAYTETVSEGKEANIVFPSDHAAPVEYGSYKMSARPYLGPAIEANKDDFFNSVGKGAVKL